VRIFPRVLYASQPTTFTTHSSTTSPQKTIHYAPLFSKTPYKNANSRGQPPPEIFPGKTGLGLQNGLEEQTHPDPS
jgi:hypothetical protein